MAENNIVVENEEKNFPLWRILLKNLVLIIILVVGFTAGGFAFGRYYYKPVYTAASQVILNVSADRAGYLDEVNKSNNTTLAKYYLPTVVEMISSPNVINVAKSYNGLNISAKSIDVSYDNQSLIFAIYYDDTDPNEATAKLVDVIKAVQEELETNNPMSDSEMKIVRSDSGLYMLTSDKTSRYTFIGFALGAILAVLISIFRYVFDNKIKDEDELEEISGTNVIAVIQKR